MRYSELDTNQLRLILTDVDEVVIVRKGRDGFYVVSCLDLKGCHSQGHTLEEAIENIKDAITAYKETLHLSQAPGIKFKEQHRPSREVVWV